MSNELKGFFRSVKEGVDLIKEKVAQAKENNRLTIEGKGFSYSDDLTNEIHSVPKRLFPAVKILTDKIRDREVLKITNYYAPKIDKAEEHLARLHQAESEQTGIIETAYMTDPYIFGK